MHKKWCSLFQNHPKSSNLRRPPNCIAVEAATADEPAGQCCVPMLHYATPWRVWETQQLISEQKQRRHNQDTIKRICLKFPAWTLRVRVATLTLDEVDSKDTFNTFANLYTQEWIAIMKTVNIFKSSFPAFLISISKQPLTLLTL